jgi:uncharacterized membrane protein YebE (DUF533 family)
MSAVLYEILLIGAPAAIGILVYRKLTGNYKGKSPVKENDDDVTPEKENQ